VRVAAATSPSRCSADADAPATCLHARRFSSASPDAEPPISLLPYSDCLSSASSAAQRMPPCHAIASKERQTYARPMIQRLDFAAACRLSRLRCRAAAYGAMPRQRQPAACRIARRQALSSPSLFFRLFDTAR